MQESQVTGIHAVDLGTGWGVFDSLRPLPPEPAGQRPAALPPAAAALGQQRYDDERRAGSLATQLSWRLSAFLWLGLRCEASQWEND